MELLVLQTVSEPLMLAAVLVGNALICAGELLMRRHRPTETATPVGARQIATVSRNESPPPAWTGLAEAEIAELGPLTDHVFAMLECDGQSSGFDDPAFVRLDDLRWLLAQYVLGGGRLRRLATLPELISAMDSGTADHSATALRSSAEALVCAIRKTNLVVADWLLTHRVAIPDPDVLDSNALFNRYRRFEIDPDTVSSDPLYLLTCHIHDILETADSMGDLAHSAVDTLEAALSRPLSTLEDELAAATAFDQALAVLVISGSAARSAEAA
jgi:hypothetical protein